MLGETQARWIVDSSSDLYAELRDSEEWTVEYR